MQILHLELNPLYLQLDATSLRLLIALHYQLYNEQFPSVFSSAFFLLVYLFKRYNRRCRPFKWIKTLYGAACYRFQATI